MAIDEPLKQVVEGTYNLKEAIEANKVAEEIDNLKNGYLGSGPEKDKKFNELLEKIGNHEENLLKFFDMALMYEDYDSCEKILDRYAQVSEETASRAKNLRMQLDVNRLMEKYKQALEIQEEAALEKLEKQMLEDYKDILRTKDNVESLLEEQDKVKFIENIVNNMDKESKEIFIYFYYEQRKIKEISKILNISESKIKTRLHRIRKKIKKELEKGGYRYE